MSSAKSHHVHLNSKSFDLLRHINAMTSINYDHNLLLLPTPFDIESKLISLGHLAGQLGGFVGESDVVKKAVKNAIIAEINSTEELKNDYSPYVTTLSVSVNSAGQADDTVEIEKLKSEVTTKIAAIDNQIKHLESLSNLYNNLPSSPSPPADSDKLQSKLEALEKVKELCENYDNLKSAKDEPKNLLENLCSGLEKFLGFNSDSKGYDGKGIVYSDLDRLCDGVMGFLYQVLKDVSEKQPYSVGKEKLKEIVTELKTNLSTGRDGFKVIAQVARTVGEYNERVKESNNHVKTIINNMNNDMKKLQNEVGKILQNNAASENLDEVKQAEASITKLADEYVKKGTNFDSNFVIREKQAWNKGSKAEPKQQFKDLNADLRLKITHARNNITHEADRLTTVSKKQKDNLAAMTTKIEDTFRSLKRCVNGKINKDVTALVNKVNEKVAAIMKILNSISETLWQCVKQLETWIRDADGLAEKAIKGARDIEHKNPDWRSQLTIENKADELKNKGEEIYRTFESAKQNVENKVKTALEQVKKMDEALKGDLYNVRQAIDRAIRHLATTLEKNVKTDLHGLETKIVGSLQKHFKHVLKKVQTEVETIKGQSGLQRFVDHVKEYATGYAATKFTNIVDDWLDEILGIGKEGIVAVTSWITAYVRKGAGNDEAVKAAVKSQISKKSEITDAIQEASKRIAGVTDKIAENVQNVKMACNTFAKQLEAKLTATGKNRRQHGPEIINFSHSLAGEIEVALGAEVTKNYDDKANLTAAVAATLTALQSKAVQVAKELELFTGCNEVGGTCEIANVDNAFDKASNLYENLGGNGINMGNNIISELGSYSMLELKNYNVEKGVAAEVEKHIPGEDQGIQLGDSRGLMDAFNKTHKEITDGRIQSTVGVHKDVLEQQLPKDQAGGGDKIKLHNAPNFTQYNRFVDQDPGKLQSLSDPNFDAIKTAGTLPAAIGEIREQIEKDFKTACDDTKNLTIFNNLSKDLKTTLTNLMNAYSAAGKEVRADLEDLRIKKIAKQLHGVPVNSGTLQKIHDDIVIILRNDLEPVLKSTTALMEVETDRFRHECTQSLTRHVDKESQEAIDKLITQANKNYVTSVKDMLQDFASKVHKELKPLPTLIDTDRQHGFKGFMRTLEGVIGENGVTSDENINLLKTIADTMTQPDFDRKEAFQNLSKEFRKFYWKMEEYVKKDIRRVNDEANKKRNPEGQGTDTYIDTFRRVGISLTSLLEHISGEHKYDHRVPGMLDDLMEAISKLKPEDFSKPNTPTMDSISAGLTNFVFELKKVYISAYDCQEFESVLLTEQTVHGSAGESKKTTELTEYGRNCAKVFATILEIINYDLNHLKPKCNSTNGDWRDSAISDENKNRINDFGHFFKNCGFIIPSSDGNRQDGELRFSSDMTGDKIFKELITQITILKTHSHFKVCPLHKNDPTKYNLMGILTCLVGHLKEYFQVCHLPTQSSTKYPTSVYAMLQWLSGLPNSTAHLGLTTDGFEGLFDKKEEDASGSAEFGGISVAVMDEVSLSAYPANITVTSLTAALTEVCSGAHDVLTSIIGHGHSEGRYACDFNTNPDKFAYPSDPSKCLDMLFEILLRLQEQLYLLYMRCRRTRDTMSWRDCWYGRGVGGSSWKCNTMQCPEQIANQKAGQIHKQTCNQNCNQTADCGIKSPLQSFLEDGLPGFMPHPYSKADCKMTCSLSNHRGIPCKTPMGFSDLSVMASHTSKGERIMSALRDFCGSKHSPLSQLCGLLLCLLNRPPQTLGDMFAFYYNFISNWNGKGREHKSVAFNGAVNDAYFGAAYEDFTINNVFGSHIHGEDNHKKGDLFGLVDCYSGKGVRTPSGSCGPYMRPISGDIRNTFASKHAGTYLSWIVYITETFYDLLKKLFEECNKCCGDDKPKCRTARCSRNCNFNGKTPTPNHADSCDSIVNCKFTRPTLYKYGFVHEDALMLADKPTKRTCRDFCKALKKVLSDKVYDDAALAKLVYVTIPNFLFKIRKPFIWLNVALWSLSLFYLICVMVGRLDVLHIRSHLRTPSSHKITAQSLLAAAQVGRLAKISYLQP